MVKELKKNEKLLYICEEGGLTMNRKSGRRNASSGVNNIKAVTWKLPNTAPHWNELSGFR